MKRHITSMSVGLAALALVLAGCSGSSGQTASPPAPTDTATTATTDTSTPTDTGTTTETPQPSDPGGADFANINAQDRSALAQGGQLTFSVGEFTPQKNQFNADGSVDTWTFWDWYNAELIKYKPNGDLNINKNYLTSVTSDTVDGKTVVTYTVNPQAKFNDGTPMDIKAFVNTWHSTDGSIPDNNMNGTDGWNQVESIEAGADDFQIVVTFKGSWPWWGGIFNTLLNPACNTTDCFNNGYVGTDLASAHPEWGAGPYKLESFDGLAGTAVLVPNDQWWGDKPLLDKVTIVQRESQAGMSALNNGEIDVLGPFTAADTLNQVKDAPGTETRTGAAVATFMLQLNSQSQASPALQDPVVRQAIMLAVDRSKIANVRFGALGYTETPPGSLLLFSYQTGYQDNFSQAVPGWDVAAAKSLLEGAGWAMGSDGYYAKDGATLAVGDTYFGDAPSTVAAAQTLQAMLKEAGIQVNLDPQASADFSTIMANGTWDMNISGFASSDPFGVAYTCQIWCSEADANFSGLNKSGTGNADIDAKIHAMELLPTAEEQIAAANALEVDAFKTFGLMPLFNGPNMVQIKTGLANMGVGVFASKSSPFADFRENIGWMP
jgi:peptide/nickel transport system substrate-binding protein